MYKMYLSIATDGGRQGFILPVLPPKIEINQSGNNKTFEVINLGEVNTINLPKLTEINIESYFPLNYGPYVNVSLEQFFSPSFYIEKIMEWREAKELVRFIFTDGSPIEIDDLFTIENFKIREEGGEVGDIYYSLDLKRYKPYAAKKATFNKDTNTIVIENKVKRTVDKKKSKKHTATSTDTLFLIAKKHLNDGGRWKEIFDLNKDILNTPEDLEPGQILKLP